VKAWVRMSEFLKSLGKMEFPIRNPKAHAIIENIGEDRGQIIITSTPRTKPLDFDSYKGLDAHFKKLKGGFVVEGMDTVSGGDDTVDSLRYAIEKTKSGVAKLIDDHFTDSQYNIVCKEIEELGK